MTVLTLLNRKENINLKKLTILGCMSGLANAGLISIINISSGLVSDSSKDNNLLYYSALFLITICIYGLTQKELMIRATHSVEDAIDEIRINLVEKILHCDLSTIDRIGRERIFTTVSKELQTISQSAQLFVIAGQASILILFTSIYIAWLSFTSFLVIVGCIFFGASVHLYITKKGIDLNMAREFKRENDVILRLNDLLDGFKEVKLSRVRAGELESEFRVASAAVKKAKKNTHTMLSKDFIVGILTFYGAIGALIFLVPLISHAYTEVVTKVATATIFLIGPISSIVGGISLYTHANAAAQNVTDLEHDLNLSSGEIFSDKILEEFEMIELKDLYYRYEELDDDRTFEIGPINMSVKSGQTIFITGGNGSGKTTFIRLLTGLYYADKGGIYVDGKKLYKNKIDAYRNLFTSVFSDFHLFQQLYGTADDQIYKADEWLANLEMTHKVKVEDKKFSTVDLSGGQRKRLALLSCVLENRPIYIFDEWAADQDPYFRKKFYEEILPSLKQKNETVIAITHDDKYFHMADLRFEMSDGQLKQILTPVKKG